MIVLPSTFVQQFVTLPSHISAGNATELLILQNSSFLNPAPRKMLRP